MSWVVTVIVRRINSLVVAVRPQAIPDRVGGRTQNPTRFCSAANHPTRRALRGDLRCRNQRSTNWCGEYFWSDALQKCVGLDSIRMTDKASTIKKPTSLVGYRCYEPHLDFQCRVSELVWRCTTNSILNLSVSPKNSSVFPKLYASRRSDIKTRFASNCPRLTS